MSESKSSTDLSTLHPGDSAVIQGIANSYLAPRLIEMGLLRGRTLRVLFQAPFNGPIAIEIGGYMLSLRKEEAKNVAIQKI